MKWQPIETAPKNESVLIFIPNAEHYGEGIYRGILVDMGTGPHWQASGLHMGRDCGTTWQPTHWQPLPDPPTGNELTPEEATKLASVTIGEHTDHAHLGDVLRAQKQTG